MPSAPLDCVVAVVIATPLTYVINRLLSSSPLRYHSTAPPLERIHLFSPSPAHLGVLPWSYDVSYDWPSARVVVSLVCICPNHCCRRWTLSDERKEILRCGNKIKQKLLTVERTRGDMLAPILVNIVINIQREVLQGLSKQKKKKHQVVAHCRPAPQNCAIII